MPKKYDVAIIGGGVAGLTSALWCDELGLSSVVVERSAELGGQLNWIHNPITNYPGVTAGNGTEFFEQFRRSLAGRKFQVETTAEMGSIDLHRRSIQMTNGSEIEAAAIVIATGVRRRELGVAGEREFRGRGIIESGSKERDRLAGKTVAVIGGGDAAIENALIIAEAAQKVFVIVREQPRARAEFIGRAAIEPKIEIVPSSVVEGFVGTQTLEHLCVVENVSGVRSRLAVDAAVVRIGCVPNSELAKGQTDLDEEGFVVIDRHCETSIDRVFAVGDIANPLSPTIATAVGNGATAIKCVYTKMY